MREIEGIERVIEKLKPHMAEIEARFNEENKRFKELIRRPHDVVGRMLKCHLVVEHYLERFLSDHYGIATVEDAKLSFFNKAMLLPTCGSSAAVVRPGILKLNALRNRVGHSLGATIECSELGPIADLVSIAWPNVEFGDPVEVIEAFTTVACTWLIVPPKALQELFIDAFAEVQLNAL